MAGHFVKGRLKDLAPGPALASARRVQAAYRRLGYMRARWPRPVGTRPPVSLAVCAIFRDEARYLAEWVTFHRIQGVERFYLYDNFSADDWRSELDPEIASGIVEVTRWTDEPGQRSAYNDCLRCHRADARWIAFIDTDEFLFSPTGALLPEVLQGFDTYPGVVVNWRIYGTNGWEQAPDGLVIENYPRRGPDDHPANAIVKSIVYPRDALGVTDTSVHYFRLRGNPVGEDGRPALWPRREPPTADLLRINHYYAKSEEEFRRKSARPRADTGTVPDRLSASAAAVGRSPPAPAVDDDSILQFLPQVRAALAARNGPQAPHGSRLSSPPSAA
jgi:hypothetical protein